MYKYVKYITVILAVLAPIGVIAEPAVTTPTNDPMVMKIYPDGTKVVVRWSEIGKAVDNGEKHGGAPRIIAYDPGKDGVVPVGQLTATNSTAAVVSQTPATSVSNSGFVSNESNDSITKLSGFYVGPELGVAFQQNVNLRNINGNVAIEGLDIEGTVSGSLTMSPGIRFNLPLGYQPVDWFSVEFAPGIIWNNLSAWNIDANGSVNGTPASINTQVALEGSYYQVPLVVNFIFKIPTDSPWVPYIGGGIGASYTYMNWTQVSYGGISEDLSNVDGSCWSLAYQGIAGLDYKITDEISLGLKYIFTGTGNQNFGGSFQDLINTKGSYSQNVMLNCTLNF